MGYFSITSDSLKWTNASHENAVLLLDHPSIPSDFWTAVSSEGSGAIRVYYWDGSDETQVAREVVDIDTINETGAIFFDSSDSLADTANEWRIYVEEGKTEPASDSTYGSEAVWTNDLLRLHLEDNTDSSGNYTPSGNASVPFISAQLQDGLEFDRDDSHVWEISATDNPVPATGDFSLSVWIDVPSGTDAQQTVIGDLDGNNFYLYTVSTFGSADNEIRFFISAEILVGTDIRGAGPTLIRVTRSGDNFVLYENGVVTDSNTVTGRTVVKDSFSINPAPSLNRNYDGTVDEVGVTNYATSADYAETEYNNQFDHDNFWTVGGWTAPIEYSASTNRQVTESVGYSGATERSVTDLTEYNGATNRRVISLVEYNGTTNRKIIESINYGGATNRKITELTEYNGDTLRTVTQETTYNGSTNRKVTKQTIYNGTTLRTITQEITYNGSTLRNVHTFTEYNGATLRIITEESTASYGGATNRKVTGLVEYSGATNRIVIESVGYNGQTTRHVIDTTGYSAQTIRNIIEEIGETGLFVGSTPIQDVRIGTQSIIVK